MQFALVYSSRPDLDDAVPPERIGAAYGALAGWFEEHDEAFIGCGAQLQPPSDATTIRHGADGDHETADGPYSSAAETLIGFSLMDVADMDAAVGIARTWPLLSLPGSAIEVRPVVE
jgi:hypothetical protein